MTTGITPSILFAVAHLAIAALVSGHALLNKRDPRAAWAWILAALLVPVGGALFYAWFGINRVERRARRELGAPRPAGDAAVADATPDFAGINRDDVSELLRLGRAMSGRPLLAGNQVTLLHNGEQAYPAMLDAIASARRSVWLASYIFDDGRIGQAFAAALEAAVQRGVQVRVLLDGIGDFARGTRGSSLLRRHGIDVQLFMPPRLFPPLLHINLRNHRKLLCVDGDTAFAGGMNIGDHHLLARLEQHSATRETAVDLHFRLAGPIAAQLAQVFAADWEACCDEVLTPTPAGPDTPGAALCRAVTNGPNDDLDRLQLLLTGALANARRRVQIMTPYFIPTAELSAALQAAALRGVEVTLILPAQSDHPSLDGAARRWLIHALVERIGVHLQPPPFAHTKMFVVDDYYALVGSANLDSRSLRLNFELTVEILDPAVTGQLQAHFDSVLRTSRRLGVQELRSQPLAARLRDSLCWLLSPYL